ncbi:MAG: hypothetical protein HGA63_10395 [Syntrophobacteraceae bacterium]|nr:hypothetical protein [Syntrophobacteraceae bacterium]
MWTNLECLSLALEPPPKRPEELQPVNPRDGLLTKHDMERSLTDAVGIIAGASPAGLYGMAQYGAGNDTGRLFRQSTAINEMLFGLTCRERDGLTQEDSEPNLMLNTLLSICVGGHLVAAMLPEIGKPLVQSVLHMLDALILAHGGLLSHAFFAAPERAQE